MLRAGQKRFTPLLIEVLFLALLFYRLTGMAFVTSWDFHENISGHRFFYGAVFFFISAAALLLWMVLKNIQNTSAYPSLLFYLKERIARHTGLAVLFLTVYYAATQFLRMVMTHKGLGTSVWDLGIYDQVLWSNVHGPFMETSIRGGVSVFAERFKPILMLVAQLYRVTDSVNGLFLLTAVWISLSIPLTYKITVRMTGSAVTGLVMAIAVFLYLPMRNGMTLLFHSQVLSDTLLLAGFYLLLLKRRLSAALLFLLAVGCKESVILDLGGLGLFLTVRGKTGQWWVGGIAFAVLCFFLFWIEPTFHFSGTTMNKWDFFSGLTRPGLETLSRLWHPNPLKFLILLTAPFAFLPFFSRGWFFLLGPSLLFRLLSLYGGFRLISAHYTAGLNALIIIGAVDALSRFTGEDVKACAGVICEKTSAWARRWKFGLRELILFSAIAFSGLPGLFHLEQALWDGSFAQNQQVAAVLKAVPSGFSVRSSETYAAHLAHRDFLFAGNNAWPGTPLKALSEKPDLIVLDSVRSSEDEYEFLKQNQTSEDYRKVFSHGPLKIYAHPRVLPVLTEDIKDRWKGLASADYPSFRKTARRIYKRAAIAFLCVWIVFQGLLILRAKRRGDSGHGD